uniref:glucan 1,3-beta-glucosidase n=1 Tax=Haptolina brevifila TaxID=156173 RepID=A0A7S2GNX6_9EUKA
MDAPVDGTSPLEYGISPEGFVTGGLNHLLTMLKMLKARGLGALLDIHSMPCNSACISDGLYCAHPLGFMAKGEAPIGDMERCEHAGGGVYPTTRKPREGEMEWPDVGVNAVSALAKWVSELPEDADCVTAFQLANEPALGPSSPEVYAAILAFYDRAKSEARKYMPTTPLIFSFMGPTPATQTYMREADAADRLAGGDGFFGDHHYYLNWQACCGVGPGVPAINQMPWDEIHRRACLLEAEGNAHDIDVYAKAGLQVIVGEWSLATNLDAHMDLSDVNTRTQLTQLYREQLETFSKRPEIRGTFFWTLRMGSGWDPRPTADAPEGMQLKGTSASQSMPFYPFQVWSLLEMAKEGIATPFDKSYEGTCAKNRCQGPLGSCDLLP